MKYILVLCLVTLVTCAPGTRKCVNCGKKADPKETEKVLKKSLDKLAAGGGPNYSIAKINSATKQLVAGIKFKINADLKDGDGKSKTCDISLWTKLSQEVEVKFNCPGEETVVKTHKA